MKIMAMLFPLVLCLCYVHPVICQVKTFTISGRITSFEESLPLEGVTIRVKNSSNITGTQADGSFSLALTVTDHLLIVALDGYEKKEIPVTSTRQYDIVLKRQNNITAGKPF